MAMFMDDSYRPEEYQKFEHETPEWYRRAKLGIFVHWGVYSVPAWAEPLGEFGSADDPRSFARNPYAEWYANTMRIEGSPAREHHLETYGDKDYYELLDLWTAENFDAADVIALVASTGARYFVPTTKHHDGVTLWPAPESDGLNTVERGPHRDLISEFEQATRAAGLRFGVYYSGGLDWHFTQLPPLVEKPGEKDRELKGRPNDSEYARYAFIQAADLIDRYSPDVLWGDIDWPDAGKAPGDESLIALFERFYDRSPEGVVNDRWGDTHWDFRTSEYQESPTLGGEAWENTRGIGYSFGYNELEDQRTTLSGPDAVRHFVDVVARGGNLLLNIGLMADGTVPPLQRATLEHLGEWNSRNGVAVFDSEPLDPTIATNSDSPWVRWTRTGGTANAIIDATGPVELFVADRTLAPSSARLLDGTPVAASATTPDRLSVDVPPSAAAGPTVVVFDVA
ncbi:alpha-L-fucosidase [Herbiconiux sp. P17]|uniref:alpha-L-fucosidase n=1 Tax=Herbiconiux wuyangfengii TaxID=3342794 RepID=UPI0035BB83D9